MYTQLLAIFSFRSSSCSTLYVMLLILVLEMRINLNKMRNRKFLLQVYIFHKRNTDLFHGCFRPIVVPIDGGAVNNRRMKPTSFSEFYANRAHREHEMQVCLYPLLLKIVYLIIQYLLNKNFVG